jgi:hypothetical protein
MPRSTFWNQDLYMAGIAFIGVRLIAALTIAQSISVFVLYGWQWKAIGLGMILVSITLWRYAERLALMLTGKPSVNSWATQWSAWVLSMYGVYILVWQIPILITRNSFGVWSILSQINDYPYWFFNNPVFIGTSMAAVLFVIGPDKVWGYIVLKWESGHS